MNAFDILMKKNQKKSNLIECPGCSVKINVENLNYHLDNECKSSNKKIQIKPDLKKLNLLNIPQSNQNIFDKLMRSQKDNKNKDVFLIERDSQNYNVRVKWIPDDGQIKGYRFDEIVNLKSKSVFELQNQQIRLVAGFGIGLIDSNFDLWRSTYNEKHKYGYPFNYLPVLKSALQKCVRRGLADQALKIAKVLSKNDEFWGEWVRRLTIIIFEDSILHPDFPILQWYVMAIGKGFKPGIFDTEVCMRILYEIAISQVKDQNAQEQVEQQNIKLEELQLILMENNDQNHDKDKEKMIQNDEMMKDQSNVINVQDNLYSLNSEGLLIINETDNEKQFQKLKYSDYITEEKNVLNQQLKIINQIDDNFQSDEDQIFMDIVTEYEQNIANEKYSDQCLIKNQQENVNEKQDKLSFNLQENELKQNNYEQKSLLIKCLKARISYGGLKGDMKMLQNEITRWIYRFNNKQMVPDQFKDWIDYLNRIFNSQKKKLNFWEIKPLQKSDIPFSAIDFHVTPICDQVMDIRNFDKNQFKMTVNEILEKYICDDSTKSNVYFKMEKLKSMCWKYRSSLNIREEFHKDDPLKKIWNMIEEQLDFIVKKFYFKMIN